MNATYISTRMSIIYLLMNETLVEEGIFVNYVNELENATKASNDGEGESLVEEDLRREPNNDVRQELMEGRNTREAETLNEDVLHDEKEEEKFVKSS